MTDEIETREAIANFNMIMSCLQSTGNRYGSTITYESFRILIIDLIRAMFYIQGPCCDILHKEEIEQILDRMPKDKQDLLTLLPYGFEARVNMLFEATSNGNLKLIEGRPMF